MASAKAPPSGESPTSDPAAARETSADSPQSGLGDIIVTAQRRSENLQRAAVAVSAVTGDALAAAGVTRPTELTAVIPSLQVAPPAGPYSIFYLRGVGNFNANAFSDSAVAFNVDGVFISRPSGTTGFFYDLERVEVVKGPQGTLYGRNATGGAINVISKKPELGVLGGSVGAEYGNYNEVRLDGALNVPLGQNTAARAAAVFVKHDGYLNDGTDDQNDFGARLSLLAEPSSDLKISIVGDYFRQRGLGQGATPQVRAPNLTLSPTSFSLDDRIGLHSAEGQAFNLAQPNVILGRPLYPMTMKPHMHNDYWGVSSTIEWNSPWGTLTLIPAYRGAKLDYLSFTPGFLVGETQDESQTSVEARFTTPEDKPLRALVGAFYFKEGLTGQFRTNQQSNAAYDRNKLDTESEAIFGRLTYAVTPEFRVNVGGRYTWESKSFDGFRTSVLRRCSNPSQFFPTYVAGCPNAPQIPYTATPPDADFDASDGLVTIPSTIDSSGPNARHMSFSKATYRVGVDWDVTDRNLLYASFETGFKSGGFFISADNPATAQQEGTFQPETISAFTIGSKNRFMNNRLQVNLEAFYWKYKNQQISHLSFDFNNTPVFATENVGQADFKGIELETRFLATETTTLTLDVQYLDAEYKNFIYTTPNLNGGTGNGTGCPSASAPTNVYTVDCSGRRPPFAPQWTLNLGLQQRLPLANGSEFVFDARAHYQTETYVGLDFSPIEVQDAYWLADAALTYYGVDRKYSVGVFVNNMFDKTVIATSFPTPFVVSLQATALRPPRTFGVRAGVKF